MTLLHHVFGRFSRSLGLCACLALVGACSEETTSYAPVPHAQERLVRSARVQPPTVSAEAVVAGHPVTVVCQGPSDAPEDDTANTAVPVIFPAAPWVGGSNETATFEPRAIGSYVTQCVDNRDGTYAIGPSIEVLPGPARSLAVSASLQHLRAGDALEVSCSGTDAFGNAVPLPQATPLGGPGVSYLIDGRTVDTDAQGRLPIDSRIVDDIELQCQAQAWPYLAASAPITIAITPSVIETLHAEVDGMFYAAHEPVPVRCTGIDALGQKRDVPQAVVQILDADADDQVSVNGQTFFADKVGSYRALCLTAEEPLSDGTVLPALVSAPIPVTIAPGAPARFKVRYDATGLCHSQTTPLPFVWGILDAYKNPLLGYDVRLTTHPATALERNAVGGYTIAEPGRYTVTLTPQGPGADRLEPYTREVVVNSTPPQIVITSPERAAMVQGNSPDMMLKGYVRSAYGPITSLTINDVPQPGAEGQQTYAFEVPYQASWGLNLLRGQTKDACGNHSVLTQSFLFSEEFGPIATEPDKKARSSHSVRSRFGQATWDDGDPNTLQDVATLMQMALHSRSLEERLPHRLGAYPRGTSTGELPSGRAGIFKPFTGKTNGIEVFRDGPLSLRDPRIEYITATDGGWDVAFSIQDLVVPFAVTQYAHWGFLGSGVLFNAKGSLTTTCMRVEAHIGVVMEDGVPKASIQEEDLHVTFAEGAPRLNLGSPSQSSWIDDFVQHHIVDRFKHLPQNLVPVIEDRVRKEIVTQMDVFLQGLKVDHSLPLPAPFVGANVISGLDAIDMHGPKGAGYGDFGLFAQIVAPDVNVDAPAYAPFSSRPVHRGPIRRAPTQATPLNLDEGQSFALAVHDDLLNQMLWALWASGMLNKSMPSAALNRLEAEAPQEVESASESKRSGHENHLLDAANFEVFLLSPPVIMPSDTDNELVIGLGDAWARADLTTGKPDEPHLRASFFFSAVLKAHIDIDPEQRHLVLKPQKPLVLHLQVNPINPVGMTSTVQSWLDKKLRDWVPGYLADTLKSFPMPKLMIGKMPGVPADAVWLFDNGTIERPAFGADTVVQGTLRAGRVQTEGDEALKPR